MTSLREVLHHHDLITSEDADELAYGARSEELYISDEYDLDLDAVDQSPAVSAATQKEKTATGSSPERS